MSVEIVTFGCRLNTFESEVIKRRAAAAGVVDTVIVHTCAVTLEAERQARQAIRRLRREHPKRKLVVTGCSVQVDPKAYAAMAEVDHLIGNHDKLKPEPWSRLAAGTLGEGVVADVVAVATAGHLVEGFDGRTRAFVQVQGGCDHRCTFCVIPYGRGPNVSVPVVEAVAQTRLLVERGYKEVVLTGVDIASWGRDGDEARLGDLVEALLDAVPGLPRLRLSSLDPAAIDAKLEDLLASHPRLMPHVHLSLQAGDDMILKRMKRRHSRAGAIDLCARLRARRPEIAFGADLIAGFPTETEAMFDNTLDVVDEAGLTFLHVFPFSPRPGTPAARMPSVGRATAKARAARLRAAGAAAFERFATAEVGRTRAVLVEANGRGHTEQFAPVRLDGRGFGRGEIVLVKIQSVDDGVLSGRIA